MRAEQMEMFDVCGWIAAINKLQVHTYHISVSDSLSCGIELDKGDSMLTQWDDAITFLMKYSFEINDTQACGRILQEADK